MLDGQRQQCTTHDTDTYILCVEMVLVLCGFDLRCSFHGCINGADRELHDYTIYTAEPSTSRVPNHTPLQ